MSEKYFLNADVLLIIDKELAEQIKNWFSFLNVERGYSKNTITSYKRDVEDLLKFINKHSGENISLSLINSLEVSDFRAWLSDRVNRELIARSNVRAISSVKSLFDFFTQKKLINTEKIEQLRRPKIAKLLPKPIEKNKILNFLNAPYFFEKDPQWITNRDRALYYLLYCTGLRINEALNIKTKDVSSDMKICGKGKKERIVLLLPTVLEKINIYINSCPYDLSANYLFLGLKGKKLLASSVDIRLEKLRLIYDLPNYASAHAFRHSFATHLIQNGADLRSVQDLLGHESLASTQIYTDVDDYNILKIYEKAHPLVKKA